jgi:histone H3/H4
VQRIAKSIEEILNNINEDIEPYWLAVSENGRDCLHQIAQTYIVRIMQEVMRLVEHAPFYTLINSERV